MIVSFTAHAEKDLDEIFAEISKDSAVRAMRMIDKITRHAEKLADHRMIGRAVQEFQDESVREIQEKPYRIIYKIRIQDERIDVLTIHHAKRLLPSLHEIDPR